GRTDPLTIYGPDWVHEFVRTLRHVARFNLKFPMESVELAPGSWARFDGYTITAFAANHGIPALGFVLEEDARPGRFNREGAIALGVPPGPLFGRLQRGETVKIGTGSDQREVRPDQVMGKARPGRKIVYTGDTRALSLSGLDIAKDADILIHDATYDETETVRAAEFFHATASQAGEAATALGARALALIHISSRYQDTGAHVSDAQKKYSGTIIVPSDLDMLEVGFRDE
ncbi:MAG: ribonuclease Z, partial [Methanomicrobiales archaeon]|nr:ribonuclease Z [Methanomicrobiales archaeon]